MKISGNTIFIPGSTSGIGLELALALQDKGNTVIIGGRRTELLDAISAAHPGLDTVHVDIADAGSIRAAAAQVLDRHPDLNVVIAMAGIMAVENWHSPESFLHSAESVVITNVLGPIRLIAAFIEHLQAQEDAERSSPCPPDWDSRRSKPPRATTRRRQPFTCSPSPCGCNWRIPASSSSS